MMEITFRRDPTNWRPRINKHSSQKDQEQKASGNFFLSDDTKLSKEEEDEDKEMSKEAKSGGGKGGSKGGGKKGKKDADN